MPSELTGRSLPDFLHHLWGVDDIAPQLQNLLSTEEGKCFIQEHESSTTDKRHLLIPWSKLVYGRQPRSCNSNLWHHTRALRNVAKHARTTPAKVILEVNEGTLHLEVRDLGTRFDVRGERDKPGGSLGMITMKERARLAHGTLAVVSSLGKGTTEIADIPPEEHE